MLACSICLVSVLQGTDKLGACYVHQDASLSGPIAPTGWDGFGQIRHNALDRNDMLWCSSVYGADDWCWHIPCALWVHYNGLTSLRHDSHVRISAFQAPQCSLHDWFWADLAEPHWIEMMYYGVYLCPWS